MEMVVTTRRTFVSLRMIPLTLVLALALPAGLAPGQRPVSPTRPLLPSAPPYTPYTPQGGADAPQQVPVGAGLAFANKYNKDDNFDN